MEGNDLAAQEEIAGEVLSALGSEPGIQTEDLWQLDFHTPSMPPFLLSCSKHKLSAYRVLWTCARGLTAIPTLGGSILRRHALKQGFAGGGPWATSGLPSLLVLAHGLRMVFPF